MRSFFGNKSGVLFKYRFTGIIRDITAERSFCLIVGEWSRWHMNKHPATVFCFYRFGISCIYIQWASKNELLWDKLLVGVYSSSILCLRLIYLCWNSSKSIDKVHVAVARSTPAPKKLARVQRLQYKPRCFPDVHQPVSIISQDYTDH